MADVKRLGDMNVGDVVPIEEKGELASYIIINKGKPSDMYDDSCDGVWLMREQAHSDRPWDSSDNDYENSDIHKWLNEDFLNTISPNVRSKIVSVKIPYKKGTGNSSDPVQESENGLSCKVFLLGGYELGLATSKVACPVDGVKIDYFSSGNSRICKNNNDTAVLWWLRSPNTNGSASSYTIYTNGSMNARGVSEIRSVRPTFVLPYDCTVNISKPFFEISSFDYNGASLSPDTADNLKNFNSAFMTKSGTFSGTNADEYEIYIGLKEGYQWSDGATDDITLKWKINPITVSSPVVSPIEYEYDGNGAYNSACYKLPTITYNLPDTLLAENIITETGDGLTKQYKAGTYNITFSLNDPSSCSWLNDDGTTSVENYTVSWKIKSITVPEPKATLADFDYDGGYYGLPYSSQNRSPVIENVDLNIMSQNGHTGSYYTAGDYYITYTLRDPDSCSWEDGTNSPKTVNWYIHKQVVYVDKPYLADGQKEFTYNGEKHTPVITNSNTNYMTVSGTVSSVAANTDETPFWEINIALKTHSNYIYKWNVENEADKSEENQTNPIILKWVVNKGYFAPPSLEETEYPFKGSTITPDIKDYNSDVMTRSGTYSASDANEYTVTYTLKDPNSAEWDDGKGGNAREIHWKITPITVAVPQLTATEVPVALSGNTIQSQYAPLESYDSSLITVIGNSSKKSPGTYTVTFRLIYPKSCTWDDEMGGMADRTAEWVIVPLVLKYPKVGLNPTELVYNGKEQNVSLVGYQQYTPYRWYGSNGYIYCLAMQATGSTSGKAAGTYTVTVTPYSARDGAYNNSFVDVLWEEDDSNSPLVLTWEIKAKEVAVPELSPKAVKYDGKSHTVTEMGFDSYIMSRFSDSVRTATAAGKYYVTYSLTDKNSSYWTDGTTDDKTVEWAIVEGNPVEIPEVTDTNLVFNGSYQSPNISEYDTALISQTGTVSAYNADTYSIIFSLKDDVSSFWADGTVEPKTFYWEITKQVVQYEKPHLETSEYTYTGKEITPAVTDFNSNAMTKENPSATAAGEHTITVKLKEHTNYLYQWADGTVDPIEFDWKILKTTVPAPTIDKFLFYYGGYSRNSNGTYNYAYRYPNILNFLPDMMTGEGIERLTIGGYRGVRQWQVGTYYIKLSLKDPDSCAWTDSTGAVIPESIITYEWSIQREIKLLPKPYLENTAFPYDGTEKKPVVINGDVDGVAVSDDISAIEKGSYTILCKLIRFSSNDDQVIYDYRWEDDTITDIPLEWSIGASAVSIPSISPEVFKYDGTDHSPVITGFDEKTMTKSGDSTKRKAGEYEIVFSLVDKNSCAWSDGTIEDKKFKWEITKSTAVKPEISPEYMMYDGEVHSVKFDGVENEGSFVVSGFNPDIMAYSGDVQKTNVGQYNAIVRLKDPDSCTWEDGTVDNVELPWGIRKKTVLLDKPCLDPVEYIFDGDTHTPDIILWKNYGMYVKDGSVRSAMNSGKYTITLCLVEDSNITYLWGDKEVNAVGGELELNWEIKKAVGEYGLDKPIVTGLDFDYDREYHSPDISDYNTVLISQYGVVRAWQKGEYTITFSLKYPEDTAWKDGTTGDVSYKWRINKPVETVEKPYLEPEDFPYDGFPHAPEVKGMHSVLVVKSNRSHTAAGTYYVSVGFGYDVDASLIDYTWADGTVADIELPWKITENEFEKPVVSELEFTYDGERHSPVVSEYNTDVILMTGTSSGINADEYTLTFSLKDKQSSSWIGGGTDDVVYKWHIDKALLDKPRIRNAEYTYNGGEHTPSVQNFDDRLMVMSGTKSAVNAGNYHIYIDIKHPQNYCWRDGDAERLDLEWTIHRRFVDKPRIDPDTFEYTGREITPVISGFRSAAMEYTENSIRKAAVVGDYDIFIHIKDNYEWSDESVDDVRLSWHIIKILVPVPEVNGLLFEYDGAAHSPEIGEYDAIAVSCGGTVSAVNAGDYQITFVLNDKEHCQWEKLSSEDISFDWKILKKLIPKPEGVTLHFVYNGGWHLPVISGLDESYMHFEGTNCETNAGNYSYKVILNDKTNLAWTDETVEDITFLWDIARKSVGTLRLVPDIFEYDGDLHTPAIEGFDENTMSITSDSVKSAWDVGVYKIVISLVGGNYEWDTGNTESLVLEWRIVAGTLKYPVISDTEFVYDALPHSPTVEGYIPSAMSIVGTMREINAGDYKLGFRLTDTLRYKWENGVADGYQYDWYISKAVLDKTDLPVQDPILIYNGSEQSPSWRNYDVNKLVAGGAITGRNAGEYTAEFSPSVNYTWDDGTAGTVEVPWFIEKCGIKDLEQINTPYYNGEAKSPQWDYSPDFVSITFSGETEGVNAREYDVSCKCDGNCYFISTRSDMCDTVWKILKKMLSAPVVKQRYEYTGETIVPEFNNYDPNVLDISGNVNGVEVGEYAAYFDIVDKNNFSWAAEVYTANGGKAAAAWRIINSERTARIPYQRNRLIYNGHPQSPAFVNYDASLMTLIGGTPSRVNAGGYSAEFRLKNNVVWSDGTVGNKTVSWEIEKKTIKSPYIAGTENDGTGMYYYQTEGKRYPVWKEYYPEIMKMSGETYDEDYSWHTTDFDLLDPANNEWDNGTNGTYSVKWKLTEPYAPSVSPGTGKKRVRIPRQINSLYADGSTKYPVWNTYDDTAIVKIGGEWEGVAAGTFTVILELRDGYVWEDDTIEIKTVNWKILAAGEPEVEMPEPIKIHIPEQINIPHYDGFVKSPEWDDWDKFGIDVVRGELYGVLAGAYTIVLRPQTGYMWEDGTTGDKTVTWVIESRDTVEIPDEPVPKDPLPEKGDDGTDGGNCGCCCNTCCPDTGLFDKLNNYDFDDGFTCDCSKEVDI